MINKKQTVTIEDRRREIEATIRAKSIQKVLASLRQLDQHIDDIQREARDSSLMIAIVTNEEGD